MRASDRLRRRVALTESVTKEGDQIDFLQKTRLGGAHVSRAAEGHGLGLRRGVGPELRDNRVGVGRSRSEIIVREFRSPQPIAHPEALEVAALE